MSLRYALDTNVLSAAFRADPSKKLLARLELHAGVCGVPAPVWHELRYGASLLRPSRRRSALERFLNEVVLREYPILPYDRSAADRHAEERARLARAGRVPPFVDGQIAAIAMVQGLVLVTDNTADFQPFQGLHLQDWLT